MPLSLLRPEGHLHIIITTKSEQQCKKLSLGLIKKAKHWNILVFLIFLKIIWPKVQITQITVEKLRSDKLSTYLPRKKRGS